MKKALKIITVFTLILSLTMSMTGCSSLLQTMQSILPTEEPTKLGDGNSDTGVFNGERYNELPTINHRTEEEIAQTGLTAQDVLNAYDQLVTDIAKTIYRDDNYSFIPQYKELADKVVAQFNCIGPYSYQFWSDDIQGNEKIVTPFYALNPNYWPDYNVDDVKFPAYPITLYMQVYIDGVAFENEDWVAVEKTQFEHTMDTLGQKSYFLDYDTLMEKVEKVDDYNYFAQFYEQNAYEPMEITRETIMNATPEQLKALYTMISSIRSIKFEHKLPE